MIVPNFFIGNVYAVSTWIWYGSGEIIFYFACCKTVPEYKIM